MSLPSNFAQMMLNEIVFKYGRYPEVFPRGSRGMMEILSFEWVWDSFRAGQMLGPEHYEIV